MAVGRPRVTRSTASPSPLSRRSLAPISKLGHRQPGTRPTTGLTGGYRDDAETEQMRPGVRRVLDVLGRVGLTARGIVFAVVGYFLIRTAIDFDPAKATRIDGALRAVARAPYGSWLLGLVALGLLTYAAASIAASRYERLCARRSPAISALRVIVGCAGSATLLAGRSCRDMSQYLVSRDSRAAGCRLAILSVLLCGLGAVTAEAARIGAPSLIARFGIASVSAGGQVKHATAGASNGSFATGNGLTQVFHVDAPLPLTLHGRLTVHAGQTLGIHTAAAAASITATVADSRQHALGAALPAHRTDQAGHRWTVRLPAKLARTADRVTLDVTFRADKATTAFAVGIRRGPAA